MTIQQCKYILKIAQCGSFSEAAKQLFVAQSSISVSVKSLEQELGIRIFERSGNGVYLTDEGAEFARYAREIVEQYEFTMNRYVNDYSSRWMTITGDMCRQALKHAAQYPKPESPVVFYITSNNMLIYRDKLNIIPSPDFIPQISRNRDTRFVVPADMWANAVAFEVYDADGKLIRVCLRGLDQKDNASTTVILPKGAARVMAVQWDGARYAIYSTTGEMIDAKPDTCNGPGARK